MGWRCRCLASSCPPPAPLPHPSPPSPKPKKQAEKSVKSADLLAGWEKPTLGFVPVGRNLPGTDMPRSEAKCPLPLQWPWLHVRLLQHRASAHPSGTALRRAPPKQQKPSLASSYALFSTGVCRRWHLEQATPTQTAPAPATCSKRRAWRAEVGTSALAGLTSCPLWALMSRQRGEDGAAGLRETGSAQVGASGGVAKRGPVREKCQRAPRWFAINTGK